MAMKLSTPEWLDKVEYPFDNKTIQLQSGTMHYVDEGEGDPILFVHGTPTWSFLYREFIRDFSKTNRAIAIDHLGFGLSEKPENFLGRPQDHTKNLSEFIQKKDLRNITLVVHDFGGPIGLAAAIKQPKRIDKIVIFNTWLWETESYKEVKNIDKVVRSFLGRFLYIWMNFTPCVIQKGIFRPICPFRTHSSALPESVFRQSIQVEFVSAGRGVNGKLRLVSIPLGKTGSSGRETLAGSLGYERQIFDSRFFA
jgi:pimeloyl-ACP methyl ester carboxylesterase